MKNVISNISPIIILSIVIGFLAATSAEAIEDFSGEWNGSWICITHSRSGPLYINLTQTGADVDGATNLIGKGNCSIQDWPLTGGITNNVLDSEASGKCSDNTENSGSLQYSLSFLANNKLSGNYWYYFNGKYYCTGKVDLTRAVNYITATAGAGGTIAPSGKISVKAGSDKTFTISPNNGYKIIDVIVDAVSVGATSSYTFSNVSANHAITATFDLINLIYINASAGNGGTITPSGNIPISPKANLTFTISPNAGYKIADVMVDGISVGPVKSYTFSDVSANHSLMATFEKEPNLSFLQLLFE